MHHIFGTEIASVLQRTLVIQGLALTTISWNLRNKDRTTRVHHANGGFVRAIHERKKVCKQSTHPLHINIYFRTDLCSLN